MIQLGLACDSTDSRECIGGGAQTEGYLFPEPLPEDGCGVVGTLGVYGFLVVSSTFDAAPGCSRVYSSSAPVEPPCNFFKKTL